MTLLAYLFRTVTVPLGRLTEEVPDQIYAPHHDKGAEGVQRVNKSVTTLFNVKIVVQIRG